MYVLILYSYSNCGEGRELHATTLYGSWEAIGHKIQRRLELAPPPISSEQRTKAEFRQITNIGATMRDIDEKRHFRIIKSRVRETKPGWGR